MRVTAILGLAAAVSLLAGCSKPAGAPSANAAAAAAPPAAAAAPAAPPAGAPISGAFTGNGKPATLTQVTAHVGQDEGQPITVLVFTEKDQGGSASAGEDALFAKYGAAVIAKIDASGKLQSLDVVHPALESPSGSITLEGGPKLTDYQTAGGQLSGHISTGGETDVMGQKVNVDLTFHAKAP